MLYLLFVRHFIHPLEAPKLIDSTRSANAKLLIINPEEN